MTPPPTDEFEKLRELMAHSRDPELPMPDNGVREFYRAAHAALGLEGCVTRELERLKRELERVLDTEDLSDYGSDFSQWMADLKKARAERDALKDEVKRLTQHTKDAHKENAILLARLVKLSAAERELWTSKATDVDSAGDRYVMDSALQKLHRVVEEIQPR